MVPPPEPPDEIVELGLPEPHAVSAVAAINPNASNKTVIQPEEKKRRFRPAPKKNTPRIPAKAVCIGHSRRNGGEDGCAIDVASAAAVAETVRVTFCCLPELSATDAGEKLQVTPAGRLEQAKLTVPAKLPVGLNTMVSAPLLPGVTDTAEEFASRLKLGLMAVTFGHTAPIAPASTEPRPVASSYPEPALQQDMT